MPCSPDHLAVHLGDGSPWTVPLYLVEMPHPFPLSSPSVSRDHFSRFLLLGEMTSAPQFPTIDNDYKNRLNQLWQCTYLRELSSQSYPPSIIEPRYLRN